MVALPPIRKYAEFVFKKEIKDGKEWYVIRYSPTQTAEEQTRRVLQRWADNPDINFTQTDALDVYRQMVSIKRKGPKELSSKV